MIKRSLIYAAGCVLFCGLVCAGWALYFYFVRNIVEGSIIAVGLLLGIGFCTYLISKKLKLFSIITFISNGLSLGFVFGIYYLARPQDSVSYPFIALFMFITVAFVFLIGCLNKFHFFAKHNNIYSFLIFGSLSLLFGYLWITGGGMFSLPTFLAIVGYFFAYTFSIPFSNFFDIFRNIAFASFGLVILVAIIVLAILSDGDADIGDIFDKKGNDTAEVISDVAEIPVSKTNPRKTPIDDPNGIDV